MTSVRLGFIGEGMRRVRTLPLHAHPAPILIWYTRGHGTIGLADGRRLPFRRDDLACIPAHVRYREDAPHGFTSLFIALPGLGIPAPHVVALGADPRFRLAARLLLAQARADGDPRAHTPALAALVHAYHAVVSPPAALSLAGRAQALIRLHAADPACSVHGLAHRLGVTPRQLRTHCVPTLGRPPLQLLLAERLRLAGELLSHGGFPIAEVATRAGFADPFYFARAFRRHAGCTPSAYRDALHVRAR